MDRARRCDPCVRALARTSCEWHGPRPAVRLRRQRAEDSSEDEDARGIKRPRHDNFARFTLKGFGGKALRRMGWKEGHAIGKAGRRTGGRLTQVRA